MLSDKKKRDIYDQYGEEGLSGITILNYKKKYILALLQLYDIEKSLFASDFIDILDPDQTESGASHSENHDPDPIKYADPVGSLHP